jgi:ABC-type dipeptide/oligopeptide/nickel transport system permease component
MQKYILRKLLLFIPTLLIVVTIVFVVIRIAGGDPAYAMLGEDVAASVRDTFRHEHGLDRPLWEQYISYLSGLVTGDLGESFASGRPVWSSYMEMLPYTLELIAASVFFSLIIGIPLGIISAIRANTSVDHLLTALSTVILGFPVFFLAIVLLLVFAVYFDLFPVLGIGEPGNPVSRLHHLILPALALGLVHGAQLLRLTRSAMINSLQNDYMRTARAKGLGERRVIIVHALRNAWIPIVTIVGLDIATALAGSVLTETVFNRPGVGKLLVGAIHARDYPLVQSGIVIFASLVIVVNLLVDMSLGFVDPRISYE